MDNKIQDQEQLMPAPIKSYSHKELVDMYQVSNKTFRGWVVPFKDKIGRLTAKRYTIKQVEMFFSELGRPNISTK
jgi:hypothetical protein